MTDPIFSERASFCQKIGPRRYRRPAISIEELPNIDVVIISHNHFDHFDISSVIKLNNKFGQKIFWLLPFGLSVPFKKLGCLNILELEWWQIENVPSFSNIKFIFTPAQHWSRRGVKDKFKTLWGSWCVIGPKHKFFFAGDTGYCPVFAQIGKMYGPFDLAAIPIGAYEPRYIMLPQHVDPEHAIKIHIDIESKRSVAIHWGTFSLTKEVKMYKYINRINLKKSKVIY